MTLDTSYLLARSKAKGMASANLKRAQDILIDVEEAFPHLPEHISSQIKGFRASEDARKEYEKEKLNGN